MHTIIRTQGLILTDYIRAHLMRRFTVAMNEFGNQIGRVEVKLQNSDEGGDKMVSVRVSPTTLPPIAVDVSGSDLYIAITIAARRAHRAVKRALRRQQRMERSEARSLRLQQLGLLRPAEAMKLQ